MEGGAMTGSQLLDWKIQMLREHEIAWKRGLKDGSDKMCPNKHIYQDHDNLMQAAIPTFWPSKFVKLAVQMAATYPGGLFKLCDEYHPGNALAGSPQWFVFEDAPISIQTYKEKNVKIYSFIFTRAILDTNEGVEQGLYILAFSGFGWPVMQFYLLDGEENPFARMRQQDATLADEAKNILGVIISLGCFLQQRVAIHEEAHVERHARKRAERYQIEPMVKVVRLRRYTKEGGETQQAVHEDREIEWTCQWVVRGHWREQAYGPHYSLRRPVWITPYIKGPEDKPLRVVPEVRTVVR
jgi:hypothetical protein